MSGDLGIDMGRQLQLVMSEEKEKVFEEFLHSHGDVVFLNTHSKNKSLNILNHLPKIGPFNFLVYIWNRKFEFKPEFGEIKKEYRKNNLNYYFSTSGKPLIEFSRGNNGRIYWEKYFTTNNPDYNVEEFEKWYEIIIKWIKTNCKYINGTYYC